MEKIYDPVYFQSSDHMNLKEYFNKFSEICPFSYNESNAFSIQQEMDLNDITDVNFLEESCSIDKLTLLDEPYDMPMDIPDKLMTKTRLDRVYPLNDNARQLNVVRCKEVMEKKWTDAEFKFGSRRFLKTMIKSKTGNTWENDIWPGSTFIYSVLIYKPFSIKYRQRNSAEKLRFCFEMEALGFNTLAQLADKIVCVSDRVNFKEVENTMVDLSNLEGTQELYPSKTIFIDGIFYNDFRSPHAIDYSSKIINWAKEKSIGKFTTAKMEDTVLDTLTPRIGYPYVYIHQGNCEHILSFSDVRLIQPSDCLSTSKYPNIVSLSRTSNILCFICGILHSKWMVSKCERFPQDKVFLCTECCNSYLYVDGKKVCNFSLYPYLDQDEIK